MPPSDNWHETSLAKHSLGDRVADSLATLMGSWKFILTQTVIVIFWITLNVTALVQHWDPYPFIVLNLLFSTQAAYAAPIIMMAQNRQAERDRSQARADYVTNLQTKEELDDLQVKLDKISQKIDQLGEKIE